MPRAAFPMVGWIGETEGWYLKGMGLILGWRNGSKIDCKWSHNPVNTKTTDLYPLKCESHGVWITSQ